MTEQAGREKIAGGRNRNRLLISLPHVIRMSSGFLFSAIILLFAERITMLDVAIIMSVGIVLSYFLISGDAVRSEERRVGKECRSRWSPYH